MPKHHLHRNGLAFALAFLAGLYFVLEKSTWSAVLPLLGGLPAFFMGRRSLRGFLVVGLCLGLCYGGWAWQHLHALDDWLGQEGVWQGRVQAVQQDGKALTVRLQDEKGHLTGYRLMLRRAWGDDSLIQPGMSVAWRGALRATEGPRNPGGYNEQAVLFGQGIGHVSKAKGKVRIIAKPSFGAVQMQRLRAAIGQRLTQGLGTPCDALARAILLGERQALSDAFYHRAQLLGIVHLFAVSGLHVGFLLAALYLPLCLICPGRGRFFAALAMALLLAYALLVGGGAAVIRASVMAGMAAWALVERRYRDPLTMVAWAALALAVIQPTVLWQMGFRLSFTVTLALLFLAPVLADLFGFLPKKIAMALAVSLAAEWASLPIIAHTFHYVAPVGIGVNLLVVPLVGVLMPGLLLTLAVDLICPPLAMPLYWLTGRGLDLLSYVVSGPGAWWAKGHWHLGMAAPVWYLVVLLLAVAVALAVPQRFLRQKKCPALLVLLLLPLSVGLIYRPLEKDLALAVLDVGQGQSVLWQGPDGQRFLFDTGVAPESAAAPLRALGVQRLDGIVLSHGDLDHAGGMARILEDFQVDAIYVMPQTWQDANLAPSRALQGRTVVHLMTQEERFPLGSEQLRLRPIRAGEGRNQSQLVAEISGRERLLFPGDLAAEGMATVARGAAPTVLMVPHHGSKNSLPEGMYRHYRPQLAIVSAGRDNTYGHPHPAVRQALREAGIPLYVTAETGMIRCYRTAAGWTVEPWL